jgi:hypothetical protein
MPSLNHFDNTCRGTESVLGASTLGAPKLPLAVIVLATIRHLAPSLVSHLSSASSSRIVQEPPPPILSGRDSITPDVVSSLISHYSSHLFSRYPLPLTDGDVAGQGVGAEDLTREHRPIILMACALAALHKSYQRAEYSTIARICRDRAGELVIDACASNTQDTLVTVVALLLYEVLEPSRGLLWSLFDFATRLCLELGWHTFEDSGERPSIQSSGMVSLMEPATSQSRAQTLSVLEFIQRFHTPL